MAARMRNMDMNGGNIVVLRAFKHLPSLMVGKEVAQAVRSEDDVLHIFKIDSLLLKRAFLLVTDDA